MKPLRKYKTKLFPDGDQFVYRTPRLNCYFAETFYHQFVNETTVDQIGRTADQWFEDGMSLKTDTKTSICIHDVGPRALVIKRYNYLGWGHSLRQTVLGTRARRAWWNAHFLAHVNIKTPKALACIEIKKRGLVIRSYLITERFDGENLYFYMVKHRPDRRSCQRILSHLRGVLDQMGKQRITHRDLKFSNIMINENELALIDLDGTTVHRINMVYKLKRKKDMRDFAQRFSMEKLQALLTVKE